jgi:hypothetical protein
MVGLIQVQIRPARWSAGSAVRNFILQVIQDLISRQRA